MPKLKKITRDINLAELAEIYPELAQALADEYGLHCFGCFAAGFDTLEAGARIHGYEDKDIEEMVEYLNQLLAAGRDSKAKS